VTVGANFDGGGTALTFSGSGNQTFTNNGGPNLTGIWTIDKPSGTVTAATSLILGSGQPLNITSGGLHLNSGSDLTVGTLTVGSAGKLISDTATTITLSGNVANSGTIDLYASGSECTGSGFRVIQSSTAGTSRNWTGNGVFRVVHAHVVDQSGTAQIRVHDGAASGTTGGNWTFDANCKASALHTPFDFDGDGRTDVAMFRPSDAEWWLGRSTLGLSAVQFGSPTDKITPADFDGDGITDFAIWREAAQSMFIIFQSATDTLRIEKFGITGDDPQTVADWDGDGKADPSVYRPGSQAIFFFRGSRNNPNGNVTFVPWGTTNDRPARGDFDGDGKQDAAVFRPSDGNWWVLRSSDLQTTVQHWGISSDKIVEGDFDGDGKTDFAVFRPAENNWYILQSSNGQLRVQTFGQTGDLLTPGDYDGDGKTDLSIWRPSIGQNWTLSSNSGTPSTVAFGVAGDIPLASVYVP
jgi:hypothetical protein